MADEVLVAFLSAGGSLTAASPANPLPTTGSGGGGSSTVTLAAGTANAGTFALSAGGTGTAVGAGTAGTPAGGVESIQGVSGGTPVPVSGTLSIGGT